MFKPFKTTAAASTVAAPIGLALAIIFSTGCMVGPDHQRPATTAGPDGAFHSGGSWKLADAPATATGQWWKRFGDETTGRLVELALANNPDLKGAAARLAESAANLAVATGRKHPTLDYGIGVSRSKISFSSPFGDRQSFYDTTWSQELQVGYVLDLWGKLARHERAAWQELLATEEDYHALANALIAQVIKSRVTVASIEKQLIIARNDTSSWTSTLQTVERRYANGLLRSQFEVHLAKENLAASQSREVELLEALRLAEHALDTLVGRVPGSAPGTAAAASLPDLPELTAIPAGLPVGLLDRRPDLKASERRLAAATERIGFAMAQMYPDLSITASTGIRSDDLRGLTSTDGLIYSLVVRLAQPIYRGGQIKAETDAARARRDGAAAAYSGAVTRALREVEDALVREEQGRARLGLLQERLKQATSAEEVARDRYAGGLENLLAVLEAERRKRLAQTALSLQQAAMWNNRVDLFLALGGDWVTRAAADEAKSPGPKPGPGAEPPADPPMKTPPPPASGAAPGQ